MPIQSRLYIDDSRIRKWIPKLDLIHRSAMPNAVRKTLNDAALHVKQVSMPAVTDKEFTKRQPNFWIATSRVQFATGFDVKNMAATVGFAAPGSVKESGHATQDLEQQETGGAIDKRAFVAMKGARTAMGNVRGAMMLKRIKNRIVDAREEQGKNQAEQFIKAAIRAGVGRFVISPWTNAKGNKFLMQIQQVRKGAKGGHIIKYKEVYSVKAHRRAHVKATHFMQAAAELTAAEMPVFFQKNTVREINKVRKI